MTFHDDIAAIQAGMAEPGAVDGAGSAAAPPPGGLREGRRMFATLGAQFATHIGSSVICLPMADGARDDRSGSAD